jgi:hypothetical protein
MAYRYGQRHERSLFPASIEDYVPTEAPVRVYDTFVEALDFGECTMSLKNGRKIVRMLMKNIVSDFSHNMNNLIRRRSTNFASRKLSCHLAI